MLRSYELRMRAPWVVFRMSQSLSPEAPLVMGLGRWKWGWVTLLSHCPLEFPSQTAPPDLSHLGVVVLAHADQRIYSPFIDPTCL